MEWSTFLATASKFDVSEEFMDNVFYGVFMKIQKSSKEPVDILTGPDATHIQMAILSNDPLVLEILFKTPYFSSHMKTSNYIDIMDQGCALGLDKIVKCLMDNIDIPIYILGELLIPTCARYGVMNRLPDVSFWNAHIDNIPKKGFYETESGVKRTRNIITHLVHTLALVPKSPHWRDDPAQLYINQAYSCVLTGVAFMNKEPSDEDITLLELLRTECDIDNEMIEYAYKQVFSIHRNEKIVEFIDNN
jgi:hypothetical protein